MRVSGSFGLVRFLHWIDRRIHHRGIDLKSKYPQKYVFGWDDLASYVPLGSRKVSPALRILALYWSRYDYIRIGPLSSITSLANQKFHEDEAVASLHYLLLGFGTFGKRGDCQ